MKFLTQLPVGLGAQRLPGVRGAGSGTGALSAAGLAGNASPIFQFNRAIIDATADLVCAYKPQFAHYAAYEAEDQLERTIEYIHQHLSRLPVILDCKRGDVGNTAERYAIEAFERYGADAVTVNPYLGTDSLEPFLARGPRLVVLCRTSNPGAGDLQDLDGAGGHRLFTWWRSWRPGAGTREATACWWSAPLIRRSWPSAADRG